MVGANAMEENCFYDARSFLTLVVTIAAIPPHFQIAYFEELKPYVLS
jgi:hypothetical protein